MEDVLSDIIERRVVTMRAVLRSHFELSSERPSDWKAAVLSMRGTRGPRRRRATAAWSIVVVVVCVRGRKGVQGLVPSGVLLMLP